MVTIIKRTETKKETETTWAEIAAAKEAGTLDKLLAERDVICFNLLDGTETSVIIEKVEPSRVWAGFVDGVADRTMYDQINPLPDGLRADGTVGSEIAGYPWALAPDFWI